MFSYLLAIIFYFLLILTILWAIAFNFLLAILFYSLIVLMALQATVFGIRSSCLCWTILQDLSVIPKVCQII